MPYRGDVFAPDQYYHVYNRGARQGPLFFRRGNYEYCLELVERYRQPYGVAVIAYCLMPNHYHFLLRQETDIPLSKFINVLFNAYVQAVNRQRGQKGTLFESRFRHVWVDCEGYLINLCRYIHLNPVKAGLVARPEDWPHSDYREWIGQKKGTHEGTDLTSECFPTPDSYRRFVNENPESEESVDEPIRQYVWE